MYIRCVSLLGLLALSGCSAKPQKKQPAARNVWRVLFFPVEVTFVGHSVLLVEDEPGQVGGWASEVDYTSLRPEWHEKMVVKKRRFKAPIQTHPKFGEMISVGYVLPGKEARVHEIFEELEPPKAEPVLYREDQIFSIPQFQCNEWMNKIIEKLRAEGVLQDGIVGKEGNIKKRAPPERVKSTDRKIHGRGTAELFDNKGMYRSVTQEEFEAEGFITTASSQDKGTRGSSHG